MSGGGGVRLHVVDAGDREGIPLVFIHGYCQSTYAWRKQFAGELARDFRLIAFDMRGHGRSEKPAAPEAYTESKLWAEDVAAVLEALDLQGAILVGWSYGGYLIGDYLRHYGAGRLCAIALVSALTGKGRAFAAPRFLELAPALASQDADVYRPAMQSFVEACVANPAALSEEERETLVATCELVPAVARDSMRRRKLENEDVLSALEIPAWCVHGSEDAIVLPASSEYNAGKIRKARLATFAGIGHSPFAEDPVRFDRGLRDLAARSM